MESVNVKRAVCSFCAVLTPPGPPCPYIHIVASKCSLSTLMSSKTLIHMYNIACRHTVEDSNFFVSAVRTSDLA
jgi:hypothetical protein